MEPVNLDPNDPFDSVLIRVHNIHKAKRSDYTGDQVDRLANYKFSAGMVGLSTFGGMFQRLCEKIYRIHSIVFRKGGKVAVADESLVDTLVDICVISALSICNIQGAEGYKD